MSDWLGAVVVWQGRWWDVVGTKDEGSTLLLDDHYGMGDSAEAPALRVTMAGQ